MQADFVDEAAMTSVTDSVNSQAMANWNVATKLGLTMDDLATYTANERTRYEADTSFTAVALHEHVEGAAGDFCDDLAQAITEQNTLRDEINAAAGFGQWLQGQLEALCEIVGTENTNKNEDVLEVLGEAQSAITSRVMDLFLENLAGAAPWMTIDEAMNHYNAEFAASGHPVQDSGNTTAVSCPECEAFGFDSALVDEINNNITSLNDALTFFDYM